MEWYFFFFYAMFMFILINGNSNRRVERLEHKIALLLERFDIDPEEIDAEIARMEQKTTAKLKAAQRERMSASVGPAFVGGAVGFVIGMVFFPSLGSFNFFWVPIGMAVGFLIGMLLARKGGDERASTKRIDRMK